jgi:hypothetical protein
MPLRNRVTPFGELIAVPDRGLVYGNRGCLHDAEGRIRRRWATKRWIACRLEFRGRRRAPLLQPGRYTELFFLDEATAFAAGHRPCAECRSEDYRRFTAMVGLQGADAIDERLHEERLAGPREGKPVDGALVLHDGAPWLALAGKLHRWTPGGYTDRRRVPRRAAMITPPSLARVLRDGWSGAVPLIHPSARR